jgi:hypothetical protein
MSMQFRLPRPAVASRLKRAGPIAAVLMAALVLVPAASATSNYTDPAGDSGKAGDITGVTISGDKGSGQLIVRVTGTNLATSDNNVLFVDIDSDSNPLTGNILDGGADYSFLVGGNGYAFAHWNGTSWVDTPSLSVTVAGGSSQIIISVNKSEIGNSTDLNVMASTMSLPDLSSDSAPDDGAYNYSFDANGPQINSVDVQTTPATGPKAGRAFVIAPTALHLPPDGRKSTAAILPESYSCTVKLGAKTLAGRGTGGCTVSIPKKKKSKGKTLSVQLTVNYQGAAKVVPLTFKVR